MVFLIDFKGKLIPIDTENETDSIELAASNSEAYALPMRPKEEISNLTTLYNVDSRPSFVSSMRSSVLYSSDADSSRPRKGFINQILYLIKILQFHNLKISLWLKGHWKYHFRRHSFPKIKSSWIWISRGDSIRSITKWVWTSYSKFSRYNETRNFWTSIKCRSKE